MTKHTRFLYGLLITGLFLACSKDKGASVTPGSVIIQALSTADTLGTAVSIAKDSVLVIGLKAMLQGKPSATSHAVHFDVDTTLLTDYKAKYGNALLLPTNAWLFYQRDCSIPAGATLSDSVEINIINQTKLLALTTYVLPVVLKSVDGGTNGVAVGQVLYLVMHTGKSPFISKTGWKIVSYSSTDGSDLPAGVLDNDDQNTAWGTSLFGTMPQNIVIDFGKQVIFSGVTYRTPSVYYKGNYGYPKQIHIELSTDGTNWTDKGLFGGQTSDATQTIDLAGANTARYLRFTATSVAPFANAFQWLLIGGIGLAP